MDVTVDLRDELRRHVNDLLMELSTATPEVLVPRECCLRSAGIVSSTSALRFLGPRERIDVHERTNMGLCHDERCIALALPKEERVIGIRAAVCARPHGTQGPQGGSVGMRLCVCVCEPAIPRLRGGLHRVLVVPLPELSCALYGLVELNW